MAPVGEQLLQSRHAQLVRLAHVDAAQQRHVAGAVGGHRGTVAPASAAQVSPRRPGPTRRSGCSGPRRARRRARCRRRRRRPGGAGSSRGRCVRGMPESNPRASMAVASRDPRRTAPTSSVNTIPPRSRARATGVAALDAAGPPGQPHRLELGDQQRHEAQRGQRAEGEPGRDPPVQRQRVGEPHRVGGGDEQHPRQRQAHHPQREADAGDHAGVLGEQHVHQTDRGRPEQQRPGPAPQVPRGGEAGGGQQAQLGRDDDGRGDDVQAGEQDEGDDADGGELRDRVDPAERRAGSWGRAPGSVTAAAGRRRGRRPGRRRG